jgi:hypothetical protein
VGRWRPGHSVLFDLANDPSELRSVYEQPEYAAIQKTPELELVRLRRQYNVPEQDPPESYYPRDRRRLFQ